MSGKEKVKQSGRAQARTYLKTMAYALDVDQCCSHQRARAVALEISNKNRGGGMRDTMNVFHFFRPVSSKDQLGEKVLRLCTGSKRCRLDKHIFIVHGARVLMYPYNSVLVMFSFFCKEQRAGKSSPNSNKRYEAAYLRLNGEEDGERRVRDNNCRHCIR